MASKVTIIEVSDGFVLKVVALASREARNRNLKAESWEVIGGAHEDPPRCTLVFEGPDEKEIVKIFREKIKEVKKADKAKLSKKE
jgi:hypothetical protein